MQGVIDFILANQLVLAGLLVAVLDLLFALNSKWKSNGILHSLYVFAKGIIEKVKAAVK